MTIPKSKNGKIAKYIFDKPKSPKIKKKVQTPCKDLEDKGKTKYCQHKSQNNAEQANAENNKLFLWN